MHVNILIFFLFFFIFFFNYYFSKLFKEEFLLIFCRARKLYKTSFIVFGFIVVKKFLAFLSYSYESPLLPEEMKKKNSKDFHNLFLKKKKKKKYQNRKNLMKCLINEQSSPGTSSFSTAQINYRENMSKKKKKNNLYLL